MYKMKFEQRYVYRFYSNEFSSKEIETYLMKEVNPNRDTNDTYRSDHEDFEINGAVVTFMKNSIWIASKKRLMDKLQNNLNILSIIKKHNKML